MKHRRPVSTLAFLSTCALACAVAQEPDDDAHATAPRKANAPGDDGRVAICHAVGGQHHTIVAPAAAIAAHLGHGDTMGECDSGCASAESCGDGNACTTDVCQPDGTCTHTAVDCSDGNPCTAESCEPTSGCASAPADGVACEDGNECTDDDVCGAGSCRGAPVAGCCFDAADCDDDNACSEDACISHACTNTPVACADADPCVVGFCDPTTGECDATPVDCNDGDQCSADSCYPGGGCVHTPAEGAAFLGTITRLSTGSTSQLLPAISGAHVVWVERVGGFEDVLLHDLVTGTTENLTGTPAQSERFPQISGDNIVWQEGVAVVLHEISAGQRRTLTSFGFDPTIDGDFVSYGEPSRYYDLALDQEFLAGGGGGQARIDDGNIVELVGGGLVIFSIASGVTTLTHTGGGSLYPDIGGNRVVYWDDTLRQLFVYDLTIGQTQQLTTAESSKMRPRIEGPRVVWPDNRNGDFDLYVYDLRSGIEAPIVEGPGNQYIADIDWDRVVYTDDSAGVDQIYMITLCSSSW